MEFIGTLQKSRFWWVQVKVYVNCRTPRSVQRQQQSPWLQRMRWPPKTGTCHWWRRRHHYVPGRENSRCWQCIRTSLALAGKRQQKYIHKSRDLLNPEPWDARTLEEAMISKLWAPASVCGMNKPPLKPQLTIQHAGHPKEVNTKPCSQFNTNLKVKARPRFRSWQSCTQNSIGALPPAPGAGDGGPKP